MSVSSRNAYCKKKVCQKSTNIACVCTINDNKFSIRFAKDNVMAI